MTVSPPRKGSLVDKTSEWLGKAHFPRGDHIWPTDVPLSVVWSSPMVSRNTNNAGDAPQVGHFRSLDANPTLQKSSR